MMCWFNAKKLQPGSKFYLRQSTSEVRSIVKEVLYKMDINHLQRIEDDKEVGMNDIVRVKLRTTKPVAYDPYRKNRSTGSVVLVDESTNETVAAGMIVD